MRYVAGLVLAAIFLLSSPAQAQRGQQIFDLFIGSNNFSSSSSSAKS